MPVRSKVRNARMLWVREDGYGIPDFGASSPISEVLAQAANPGDSSFVFADDVSGDISQGSVIALFRSDMDDIEFYKAGTVSTETVNIDSKTPIRFRREAGYGGVVYSNVAGFKRVPGFIGTTLDPNIALLESQEVNGNKGIQGVRPDVVRIAGDINLQIGIENSGALLRDVLNAYYYQDAPKVSPAADGTLNGAVNAGGTQIIVNSVPSGWSVGDVIKINDGKKSELVKLGSSWDEMATTIPLDAETPLMYAHDNGVAVEKVTTPYTHIIERGAATPSNTFIIHFTDSDVVAIYRGVKFGTFNMSVNPTNGLLNVAMSVVAKSVQTMDEYIFGAPTTFSHIPLTNWESIILESGNVLSGVQEYSLTIDNQIETDGFENGSRFIGTADEDKGRAEGNFTYKFYDGSRLAYIFNETEKALTFNTVYKAAGSIGQGFKVVYPRSRFGGSAFPQVPNSGFVTHQSNILALYDETAGTDVRFEVTDTSVRLA